MTNSNKKYFIALTGAKKNVGDFLITERAIALLNYIAPEFEFIIHSHWKEIDDIKFVNNSEGIIILGGPGFQMDMFPGVYKLVKDIKKIEVPIFTLGGGWKGTPGDKTTEKLYEFTSSAKQLLDKMNDTAAGMSCRDHQTLRVLRNTGYKNVTMTGCPVWYDINSIGKMFVPPQKINRVVYTPAQGEFFSQQSIEVLKYIKSRYKDAEIIVSFHRGIGEVDEFTSESDAKNTRKLAAVAEGMGANVVDVSYDATKLNFYDDCDLHIGYRVHAHIYFLSKRLPSILLHEDGRGNGVSEALRSPGINAYRASNIYSGLFGGFRESRRLLSIYKKLAFRINSDITQDLEQLITRIETSNYDCFKEVSEYIDSNYKVMEKYIKDITSKNKEV
ncbi:polysaccharide pyruvyl transferase family protein [Bacillus sp. m3-13]|uniref:polysaccharide pyruvyl transferase family protein n=1 Tax=Bacillus sp. m3-13 TaxID=406124 RepID=UPI0001E89E07|nr:polysaccharide pyruvyl transferase family protein [Bacillus sp. m3-13]